MVKMEGVYSVLPTPFAPDGEVDKASLEKVVDLFLAAGVNGITALGVTSEASRLSERERALVLDITMSRVDGRVPVVVGTTAQSLRTCIQYSKEAAAAHASAVMVSPPRMPKLHSQTVLRHYSFLAEAIDIPIVVQDYPTLSGFSMEPWLLAQIAREVSTARTIKMEDPPTPVKIAATLEEAKGIDVRIFGGLGAVYLLEELMAGAAGTMTGFAYPEILVETVRMFRTGDIKGASDRFYRCVPLMRFEFQEGIGMAIRKEMLRRRGALAHGVVRSPGANLDPATRKALDQLLDWFRNNEHVPWISD